MDSKLLSFTGDIQWLFSFCGRNSVCIGNCHFSYCGNLCW